MSNKEFLILAGVGLVSITVVLTMGKCVNHIVSTVLGKAE